ncbi:NADPH:quinone oxidoreductase [Vulcanimicrobium alpinum]|uniref:NADPH:quinone oxidoreductase n=1 Tax=Vulcanimicrobium alpinum TaxID=3016050 RepID=A0AAN1XWZ5_UNVUL|nr:zinc-binding dehydrogenase [Vulcanimicrobium alpinum]BDE06902.1 NADPH:quinone oxidoreductase [Vulcanimicrobium alpinum]
MNGDERAMRAARVRRFGPRADALHLDDLAIPAPQPGEVVVRVRAAAVTPLDTYLRAGVAVGDYTPILPYTPGSAFAGIVAEIGAGVTDRVPGERVYGRTRSGAAAEWARCDAREVFPLPGRVDFADGAVVAVPFETAWWSLVDVAAARGGDVVLVQGAAGSVGAAAVQLARAMGLHVIATCAADDAARVRAHGAHAVIDFRDPHWTEAVREASGGRGVDVVVEVAAATNLVADAALAAPGGRIVVVGGTGATTIDPLVLIAKGLHVAGVDLRAIAPDRRAQIHAGIAAGLENGTLRPHAAHRFALHEIVDAHGALEERRGAGGVVLVID